MIARRMLWFDTEKEVTILLSGIILHKHVLWFDTEKEVTILYNAIGSAP